MLNTCSPCIFISRIRKIQQNRAKDEGVVEPLEGKELDVMIVIDTDIT